MMRTALLTFFVLLWSIGTIALAENVQNMNMVGKWPVGECVAVAAQGNYLAVSAGYGIRILDINNPARPVHVSSIATPGNVSDFRWEGDYLYISLNGTGTWAPPGTAGLYIVNTSTITAPYRVGFYQTSGPSEAIEIKGQTVFLSTSGYLKTFDVSNPANPQPMQEFSMTTPQQLHLRDNLLFAAAQGSGVQIFEVSNPAAIQSLGNIAGFATEVYATGNRLFISDNSQNQIPVYDISNPASPTLLNTLTLPTGEMVHALSDNGSYFFVVSHRDTTPYGHAMFHLRAYDLSNISSPITVAAFSTDTYSFSKGRMIFANSHQIAIAQEDGFRLMDFSNTGGFQNQSFTPTNVTLKEIQMQNQWLYVRYLTPWNEIGLSILNVSNPAMPVEQGWCLLSHERGSVDSYMSVQGDTVYITHDETYNNPNTVKGITLVDVSDPSQPQEIQTVTIDFASQGIASDAHHVFLAAVDTVYTYSRELDVCSDKMPLGWGHNPMSLKVIGNYLIVGTNSSVHLVDLSSGMPVLQGGYNFPNSSFYNTRGVDLVGHSLFVSCDGDSGFLVLDVSDPANIHRVSAMKYAQDTDVAVSGNYGYIANGYLGVRAVDISNLSAPQEVGYYQTERGWANALELYGQFICAAYQDVIIFENTFISELESSRCLLPQQIRLEQNYPNPFNPATTIRFALPHQAPVRFTVYNILGEKVTVLVNRVMPAGEHRVTFQASALPSGTYLYELKTGDQRLVRKMLLLK